MTAILRPRRRFFCKFSTDEYETEWNLKSISNSVLKLSLKLINSFATDKRISPKIITNEKKSKMRTSKTIFVAHCTLYSSIFLEHKFAELKWLRYLNFPDYHAYLIALITKNLAKIGLAVPTRNIQLKSAKWPIWTSTSSSANSSCPISYTWKKHKMKNLLRDEEYDIISKRKSDKENKEDC